MPIVTPGRVEARMTVPPGGAAVSASNGSLVSPATVTVPAGGYYHTAGGGVSGLLATLEAQLNAGAPPSSGAWTVSLGADGRVSIGCTGTTAVPSFSLDWTNTTLRDVCGFVYNINYPTSAAEMARQVGYGTWTSGYLCNESSGNLAPAFGATALTPGGTPVYSGQGPRGGADKAVSFNANTEYFSGGDINDVSATSDLCIAWVGYHGSATVSANSSLISKYDSTTTGRWAVYRNTSNLIILTATDGAANAINLGATAPVGAWYVGIAVIDRAAGQARIATRTLAGVTSTGVGATTALGSLENTTEFRLGKTFSGINGDTDFQCAGFWIGTGVGAAAGMSANIATALSNFVSTFGTWTGTKQARGLWYPGCTLDLTGDPRMAPRVTDKRETESPTGVTRSLSSTYKRKHKAINWSHVTIDRVRESSAPYANGSWEAFLDETQFGLGSSWFESGSMVQIYDHNGDRVGADANVAGWWMNGVHAFEDTASLVVPGYTGLWDIRIPGITAQGG